MRLISTTNNIMTKEGVDDYIASRLGFFNLIGAEETSAEAL